MNLVFIAIACGVIALLYGILTSQQVLRASQGNQRMIEVAGAIQEGAAAYLKRQYTAITVVGVVVAALVFFFLGGLSATAFVIGSVLSGVAGF
jgi:K(+)-stimulated pyrophosphate-energized sodium pump